MWLLGLPFHPLVGLGFVGWSVVFIESWRLREKALAVAWGCYNFDRVEQDRPGFVGDGQEIDPATGAIREKWRFRQTLSRGLASIPALAVFTSLLVAIVSGIYVVETVFNEVYDGPATIKKVLVRLSLLSPPFLKADQTSPRRPLFRLSSSSLSSLKSPLCTIFPDFLHTTLANLLSPSRQLALRRHQAHELREPPSLDRVRDLAHDQDLRHLVLLGVRQSLAHQLRLRTFDSFFSRSFKRLTSFFVGRSPTEASSSPTFCLSSPHTTPPLSLPRQLRRSSQDRSASTRTSSRLSFSPTP